MRTFIVGAIFYFGLYFCREHISFSKDANFLIIFCMTTGMIMSLIQDVREIMRPK
jgi:hypothetical protein